MIMDLSLTTCILFCLIMAATAAIFYKIKYGKKEAPGPRRWPLIGSLPYMAKYANTYDAFTALSKDYGDIVTLKLGTVNSILVSGPENIREVLIYRGQEFDSRAPFRRFDMLFEGNRNNSLAFADWSENQKKRREIVGHHAFPQKASQPFNIFQTIASTEILKIISSLKITTADSSCIETAHFLKNYISECCFKIFLKYFCDLDINSTNYEDFSQIMKILDDIFQEVNSGCIGDIFPILLPFCNKSHLEAYGKPIRKFTLDYCVNPKNYQIDENGNNDKVSSTFDLLDEFQGSIGKGTITEETALFALEDMIAGHSAMANMLTIIFHFLGQNPQVQEKIRQEVSEKSSGANPILVTDNLSYTEAVIWEALRHITSPLVPHVAAVDTHLKGFPVKKGTVLFFNNGDLNKSPALWDEPERFEPERFLKGGQVLKPDHYFPFGTGRRSCLGFKLLLYTSVLVISNLCTSFEIGLVENETCKWQRGSLAVPGQGFGFTLKPLTDTKL